MNTFETFQTALHNMVSHNATHAFDCVLLGLHTPLIEEFGLCPLVDIVSGLKPHEIEILKGDTREQRRVIEATRTLLGHDVIGFRNLGGHVAEVIKNRTVTCDDVITMRISLN
jgi:hypothetical protein